MSENGLTSSQHKMRDAGVAEQAITVFTHYYQSLEAGATGLIPEETIEPLTQIDSLADVEVSEEQAREALSKTVLIRLNGGLGTSMGLERSSPGGTSPLRSEPAADPHELLPHPGGLP